MVTRSCQPIYYGLWRYLPQITLFQQVMYSILHLTAKSCGFPVVLWIFTPRHATEPLLVYQGMLTACELKQSSVCSQSAMLDEMKNCQGLVSSNRKHTEPGQGGMSLIDEVGNAKAAQTTDKKRLYET
ncbi:MAG: hypothetical protein ACFBSG_00390 [Leptolyngbyaceae cyanobacterium]